MSPGRSQLRGLVAATALWRELKGEAALIAFTLRRVPKLRQSPLRELFLRFYLLAGVESLGGIAVRAAVLGALLIGYVVNVMAADAGSAIRLLESIVVREVAPIFATLIVMAKAAIELTGQLAWMRERGETDGLALLGVMVDEFLALPCVAGIAAATAMLTLYFELLAVGGGLMIASLVADVSFTELAERFLLEFRIGDLVYALCKGILFGLLLGAVSTYHGLRAPAGERNVARPVSRAVMQALFVISLANGLLAYVIKGQVLFGIVRAA
jgi:phospholipid/cholesterol/gamma-HCH transport system permease protein